MWALDLYLFLVLFLIILHGWKYRTPGSLDSDDSRLDGDGDYSIACQLEALV